MYGNELDFRALVNQISRDRGFDCSQYRETYLKRRFAVRLRRNHIQSYREYLQFLKKNPDEYNSLIDALTINVTQFFRSPETYNVLKSTVLPKLIGDKKAVNSRRIRIWSAGCASGEEPYSIAMVVSEVLGKDIVNYNVSIIGTDIDDRSLRLAEKGVYPENVVKSTTGKWSTGKWYLNKYFTRSEDNMYMVNDRLKSLVQFKKHNLLTDRYPKNIDMIFCRNVIIYLSRDFQKELFNNFYRALNMGGYLVIGKVETLSRSVRERFSIIDNREHIYQKKNGHAK